MGEIDEFADELVHGGEFIAGEGFGGGHINFVAQFGNALVESLDMGEFDDVGLEGFEAHEKVVGDVDAFEGVGFFRGEGFLKCGDGDDFEGAQPSAEGDEVCGVDVPKEDHFGFDVGLGGGEFVFESVPIAESAVFDHAFEVAGDAGSGAEDFSVFDDLASDAFEFGEFLRLDDEEAVRDEAAEAEGELGAVARGFIGEVAAEGIVGEIA